MFQERQTWLSTLARRAAALHIDILLLPEAFLGGGYPRGASFGCTIGSRTAAGRDAYLAYFRSCVDLGDVVGDSGSGGGEAWVRREIPGGVEGDGTREELERIARETGVYLVVGVVEKAGGSLYCSVVFVCPEGGCRGKRRKVMPTGTERLVWAQGGPATLKAVGTVIRGVRVNMGAAVCWENYMPLVRQALYAQNVNLYLAPTADGRDTWLALMRTVGIEGRCFVVSSNMCVREGQGTAAAADDGEEAVDGEGGYSPPPERKSGHRRPSCVTAEGFEIALPAASRSGSATGPALSTTTASRRLSVLLDDDGNEIVLPASVSPSTSTRRTLSTAASRRLSVFDDDGNEIVLPRSCSPGAATAPPPPRSTTTTTTTAAAAATTATGMAYTPAGSTVFSQGVDGKTREKEKEREFISRGGSAIVGPFGDVLAGPQWEDDDGILWADVDFDDCVRGRLDLDVGGSYSRNDSFKFSVQGLDLTPLPY
ncbi:carbon-nitrogen hydrolase [Schizothecium vesticola]|uniref:Carbon-nitrogen hydrolase n=1 Tax=Schizothecium vesticola TaxID=314040 RepID=A0AA40EJE7_9PEZI|nr:carbon-nitrogen hydrolase [Schizothecium vesticola]